MIRRSKSKQKSKGSTKPESSLIRQNTATLYGLFFVTSNTDFLLNEKKTRFSVRPDVILKQDRQTTIFDYSAIKGSDQASIFDGFFRGLSGGGTACQGGVTAGCTGATLGLAGAVSTTCNFIDDVTGIPRTNFADTYTLSSVDVTSKTIVAIKNTPITTTTAVKFIGNYFIDLPQWTKTQTNETSTPVKKIINLLSRQSLHHLGIRSGSVIEFKKTKSNNKTFTVVDLYTQNGFEVIEVNEEITKEDATNFQVIVSVYGEEEPPTQGQEAPPLFPAPDLQVRPIYNYPNNKTWPRINTCCPCMSCLLGCIRQAESGSGYKTDPILDPGEFPGFYPIGPDPSQIPDNSILRGCNPPCTDGGTDCGPYQIDEANFIQDICDSAGPCSNGDGGWDGPLGLYPGTTTPRNACCEVCQSGFGMQDYVCPGDKYPDTNAGKIACCREKDRRARLLIDCYQRRWTRNNISCPGNGDTPNPIDPRAGNCYLCEDIGRMHQGGQCGHQNPSVFNNGYWAKVKKCMQTNCSYRKRDNGDGTFTEFCQDPVRPPSIDPTIPGFVHYGQPAGYWDDYLNNDSP